MATNTYKREVGNVPRPKNAPRVQNEPKGRTETRAPKEPKEPKTRKPFPKPQLSFNFVKDRRLQLGVGFFFLLSALYLAIAFVSFLFTGTADQSVVESVTAAEVKEAGLESENWLGLFGAWVSDYFINRWFGVASFFFIPIIFFIGYKIVFRRTTVTFSSVVTLCLFGLLWGTVTTGYVVLVGNVVDKLSFLSGAIGFESAIWLQSLLGWGTGLLLAFLLVLFVIFFFNITTIGRSRTSATAEDETSEKKNAPFATSEAGVYASPSVGMNHLSNPSGTFEDEEEEEEENAFPAPFAVQEQEEEEEQEFASAYAEEENEPEEDLFEVNELPVTPKMTTPVSSLPLSLELEQDEDVLIQEPEAEPELDLAVQKVAEEEESDELVSENYDPTLDLPRYQYPSIDLLIDYGVGKVQVTKEELEANKDKIVETLGNYSIGIASIKATIGPTVTLYEIVPDAGVRISKIKSLEDDIALSLAALGIRIIAPIPGKGTIGIEVPNKKKEMVSIKSILSTEKFLKSEMDLPIAFGKTITNEVFIADLAKMPHLLMAGATGQGKSVGLNAILTSLLYKRHPSQLKFVLVDPKKVELSLFNKIERHFLAKLPDTDEAIITDTKKVVNTLNSLCMEMDQRYDLLKDAGCRNLKEYNLKFVERRLNPKKGHRFMPFIVLVIDELADLMMTAGKEVETPIARLAQLARAIGIHLVVATQRPSVNVITGIIKANFPARISFKVTSKIDSRTILDTGGADQLIGQGDMLFSLGSDLIRVQCAFVDTPEVDRICEFIGEQQGYSDAYLLPEFVGDEGGNDKADFDPSNKDAMFEEAARIVVTHQQGSTSLLQRRLKLGYNRAGRLIDQLEAAGVVGPFEGSKAREVLIPDEYSLEQLLNNMDS
ncbi:FtsK/SpoIIIE family DNA translocase [Rufibacter quisquiliarum]|uniref:S-DNA-T family DNA segregation ATPase FtsK/SpoIIIE n=1 Tax=Rufibacter quisquiliarum TaxID=1549639 RepID=A0A839GIH1_9BACT|nr:DNA translocase FtsK [Rufibacter quisquiliarum]MBA9075415.1 S-DNA-T family DNA segregation ATPase FtsK/SpoIIIE [Rufibacter quisquiliarum]